MSSSPISPLLRKFQGFFQRPMEEHKTCFKVAVQKLILMVTRLESKYRNSQKSALSRQENSPASSTTTSSSRQFPETSVDGLSSPASSSARSKLPQFVASEASILEAERYPENVTVTVRFRPLSPREIRQGEEISWVLKKHKKVITFEEKAKSDALDARKHLDLEFISFSDRKEAVAKAANYLFANHYETTIQKEKSNFAEPQMGDVLAAVGSGGQEPNLLLIYGSTRCHFGFPAWRLRYTEMVHMGTLRIVQLVAGDLNMKQCSPPYTGGG